jgi:hypothetical protein
MTWVRSKEKTIMKTSEYEEYKGVLKFIYADYPELYPAIDNSILAKKNMIDLAKKYHKKVCSDTECIIYEKNPKLTIGIGAGLTMGFESLSSISTLGDERLTQSYYSRFILNLSCSLGSLGERSSIKILLLTSKFSIQSEDDRYKYKLTGNHLFLPVMYQFNLSKSELTPYLSAGILLDNFSKVKGTRESLFVSGELPLPALTDEYEGMYVGPTSSLGFTYNFFKRFYFDASLNGFLAYSLTDNIRGWSAQASVGVYFE